MSGQKTVRRVSRAEFLEWVKTQPGRYERIDGVIVAMAPERGAHLRAKAAIWLALRNALRDRGVACQALPDGATVAVGENDYEPDAIVNCGEPMADDAVLAPNPVVVVEVLSPATTSVDTGGKLFDYFQVPSIQHYLIVHPTLRRVIHHRRNGPTIVTQALTDGRITLDPPGITIAVADIYAG
jgi:Uma2 family endonuclease